MDIEVAPWHPTMPPCCTQEAASPAGPAAGGGGGGGRSELLPAARSMLDRRAQAAGKRGTHFPLLLNSSGVMVRAARACTCARCAVCRGGEPHVPVTASAVCL
jgi:hypothetical protein